MGPASSARANAVGLDQARREALPRPSTPAKRSTTAQGEVLQTPGPRASVSRPATEPRTRTACAAVNRIADTSHG